MDGRRLIDGQGRLSRLVWSVRLLWWREPLRNLRLLGEGLFRAAEWAYSLVRPRLIEL